MTLKVTHKHGTTAGTPPAAGDIDVGELAINAADAEIYTKDTAGAVQTFKSKFTQSGTGAVQRTVESKLRDAVSVKDFGAVGDGANDDTAAIQAAVDSGQPAYVPAGEYKTTATIELFSPSSFTNTVGKHLHLAANATIDCSVGLAVHLRGNNNSLTGSGASSVVKTGASSPEGVVRVGHSSITDSLSCFYNNVQGLRIAGNDSLGTASAFETNYTVALMLFNAESWGSSSAVYYNTFSDLIVQDAKEGILLAGLCNANRFDNILFWRIGQSGLHFFNPQPADSAGLRYGYDWDTQTLSKTAAECTSSNTFMDSCFFAYSNTPGYPSRTFSDGSSFPAKGTMLRMTGHHVYHALTNFSGEPGVSNSLITGYEISSDTAKLYLQGGFNVQTGTNLTSESSIFLNNTALLSSAAINSLFIYEDTRMMVKGTAAAPVIRSRNDLTTGIYLPTDESIGLTAEGVEGLRVDVNGTHIGPTITNPAFKLQVKGNTYTDGDTRTKSLYSILDNVYSAGTASFRWSVVYSATGTINTSDKTTKQSITPVSDPEQKAALEIKGLIRRYKFNDAVERKGSEARWHFGVMAQDIKTVFEANGLKTEEYGLFCEDVIDEETGETRLGVRYSELFAFILAAI